MEEGRWTGRSDDESRSKVLPVPSAVPIDRRGGTTSFTCGGAGEAGASGTGWRMGALEQLGP